MSSGKGGGRWWVGLLVCAGGLQACSGGGAGELDAGQAGAGSSAGAPSAEGGSAPAAAANGGGPADAAEAGSAGHDDACVPSSAKCLPTFECGSVDDGCGKQVECGSCGDHRLCSGHECVDQCAGCVVDSICIGDGGSRPSEPCLVCDVASGKLVARTQGACDDGDACTTDDHCEAGRCAGVAKTCTDGVACNGEEACNAQSGQCVAGSSTCGTGICDLSLDACTSVCSGCTIGQVCYQSGARNPANPCQACRPELSLTSWIATPGVSCGNDDTCSFNHVCSADGECQFERAATGVPCSGASPNTTCAAYACDGLGSCVVHFADATTACAAPKACQKQDHCDGQGSCEAGGPQPLGFTCKELAACSGAASSPTCECVPGAQAAGSACVDVNECSSNTDNCDSKPDACVNDQLGFHCACPGKFTGTGVGDGSCACNHPDWSPLCEPWSQVALQGQHACALSAGALFCWGRNDFGQVGTGDQTTHSRPARVGTFPDWDLVAVGAVHSCAIRAGALYCWGNNAGEALGTGSANPLVPARVGAASDWAFVATAGSTQCGIRQGGALYCWGANAHGQLGLGFTSSFVTTPTLVPGLSGISQVSLKSDGACAIAGGKLYCWGGDSSGELGTGTPSTDITSPVRITQFDDFVDVDTGANTSCATRMGGSLYCWGRDYQSTPSQVDSSVDWQSVSSGDGHRCALKRDGSAYCWGYNSSGALGDGTTIARLLPTAIAGGHAWTQLVADVGTSCGIHDGGLYCWGSNGLGVRGNGFTTDLVGADTDWTSVTTGPGFTCALKAAGSLHCWGGYPGSVDRASPWTPTLIGQASDDAWTSIDAGLGRACGIQGGDAYCWGANGVGQVGNGQTSDVPAPTRVGSPGLWQQLSVSDTHTCGIRDGNLYCWGSDDAGQIGNGTLPAPTAPELVATTSWTQVATGSKHSCAIKAGALYCWGDNTSGQLGIGLGPGSNSPVRVGSASDWIAVFADLARSCGIRQGGGLSCWGAGKTTPALVSGLKPCRAAEARDYSQCALQTDGKLYCWGSNVYGQLGIGEISDASSPLPAVASAAFNNISLEDLHACGVTTLGSIRCWGDNFRGALGRAEGFLPTAVFNPTLE